MTQESCFDISSVIETGRLDWFLSDGQSYSAVKHGSETNQKVHHHKLLSGWVIPIQTGHGGATASTHVV